MALDAFKTSGQLTSAEITFVTNLSGLTYVRGDILYYNGTNLTNLGIGTANQVLTVNAGATAPEWQANGGGGANTALSNLASVAINTTLVSDTDNTDALGTAAISWSDLWLGNGAVITFSSAPSTADVTITHSANTLTIAGGDLALGANSLTMTGSLAATGARVTKGWFTDIESTNMPTVGGSAILTSLTAPQFTTIELGHASDTTLSRASAGNINIEGNLVYRAGGTDVPVSDGGTGVSTITALSVWVANSANTITEVTPGAGNSIRVNGAGTAWEAFTPSASVPTAITVANEATDTSCFPLFVTAATGDLGPKTVASFTLNSNTGALGITSIELGHASDTTLARVSAGVVSIEGATILVSGGALGTPSSGTVTNLTGTASININGTVGATTPTTVVATTITANTGLVPDADDGAYLGQSGTAFSDLFLASGGVINWNAGNATLTHSTGLLTSNVALSLGTSNAFTCGTIELGAASDTTLARVSAGVVSIEGVNILTVAGGTLTGNITLGENTAIALDPAGSADGKYTGITISGTAGATLAFGDVIVLDVTASKWLLADANSAAAADGDARGLIGICVLAANDTQTTNILLNGTIRADAKFPALTITAPVYLSETAGAIVVAQPTTTDVVIRTLGFALTADEIYFNPSSDYITHT